MRIAPIVLGLLMIAGTSERAFAQENCGAIVNGVTWYFGQGTTFTGLGGHTAVCTLGKWWPEGRANCSPLSVINYDDKYANRYVCNDEPVRRLEPLPLTAENMAYCRAHLNLRECSDVIAAMRNIEIFFPDTLVLTPTTLSVKGTPVKTPIMTIK